MTIKATSWNERFALIEHYKPTDEQIIRAFNIPQNELDTARTMLKRGMIAMSKSFDAEGHGNPFGEATGSSATSETVTTSKPAKAVSKPVTKTSTLKDNSTGTPESATKKASAPKKRGRKGDKINEAFKSIPTTPTPIEDFSQRYGVSIPVLRQSRRFDKYQNLGQVKVRVNKTTSQLEIWRESGSNEPQEQQEQAAS